jgi:DNA-binding transcriptional ArsR family regulator
MAQSFETLLKLFAHPLRVEIFVRLLEGAASPAELQSELGSDVGLVVYHIRRLEVAGLVMRDEAERPRCGKGHQKQYYRASPLRITDEAWMEIPQVLRESLADAALRELAGGGTTEPGEAEKTA